MSLDEGTAKESLVSFEATRDHAAQSRKLWVESFPIDASIALVIIAGIATFVLHVVRSGAYGYERDELYFMWCAQHLAWGYVDQPPLIALVAKIATLLFGTSLVGIRLLPALAAAATVAVTGRVARRLGGGPFAQGIAMLALALAPFYLAVGSMLTMNAFEPLLWMSAAYLFFKAEHDDRPGRWLALGLVIGLGLLNKYSMFFYLASACVAIALTPQRRAFRRPGFWLAVAVGVVLVAPSIWWQTAHGWPQLEVLRNAASTKNVVPGPLGFFLQQILMMNPISAPLWLAGLGYLLLSREGERLRWFGYTYVILSLLYLALQAKVYYLAPIYPVLFGAGGVVVERALRTRTALAAAYSIVLALSGLAMAPEAFPLLPLRAFIAYQHIFDVRGIKMEKHPQGTVPQQFADMLGWDTLAATMARAYEALPEDRRAKAAILTHDYGQAAAIDFYGRAYRLPHALSGHNNYFLYGTQGYSGDVVLAVGLDPRLLRTEWRSVKRVATFHDDYVLPDQNDLPIYVCSDRIGSFAAWWPHVKRYI
jgi:hypothetical protein